MRGMKAKAYSLQTRISVLRALLTGKRTLTLNKRVDRMARRRGPSVRTPWRWIARYRAGGVQNLRDRLRSDLFTHRIKVRP